MYDKIILPYMLAKFTVGLPHSIASSFRYLLTMSVSIPTLLIVSKDFRNDLKKGPSFVNGMTAESSTLEKSFRNVRDEF